MMMDRSPHEDLLAPVAFTPGVRGNDPLARYWLGQASLRLRRELCWLWRERAQSLSQLFGLLGLRGFRCGFSRNRYN